LGKLDQSPPVAQGMTMSVHEVASQSDAGPSPDNDKPSIFNFGVSLLFSIGFLEYATHDRGAALMSILWGFWVMGLTVTSLFLIATQSARRRIRAVRIGIWIFTSLTASLIISHRVTSAREEADRVAAAVIEYKTRTGVYPKDMDILGLDHQANTSARIVYLFHHDKNIDLMYTDPWEFKETHRYDFVEGKWRVVGLD
jgi:hypothetical protein